MSDERRKREARYYPGLEVSEDMSFKEKDWRFERAGWLAMALIIVAALFGLFSQGPLSRTEATDSGGALSIRYERFQRFQTPTTMEIEIRETAQSPDIARILIGKQLIQDFEIETIRPAPQDATLTPEGWVLDFPVADAPAFLSITLRPESLAMISGRIGLEGQAPAELKFFVYP